MSRLGLLAVVACAACAAEPAAQPEVAPQPMAATLVATADAPSNATSAPPTPPPAAPAAPAVEQLTPAMIRDVVRANYDKMAACYQRGLTRDPAMKGTIEVSLAIDSNGSVVAARVPPAASEIRDADVLQCVVAEFEQLRFPASRRGMVNTVYPLVFAVE